MALVTDCRLGKRALKFFDWGKMAATFVDLQSGRAIRVAARESEKERAQQRAYRVISDDELFEKQRVRVRIPPEDQPGYKGPRIVCEECGEGIQFKREVNVNSRKLCRGCAQGNYYEPLP